MTDEKRVEKENKIKDLRNRKGIIEINTEMVFDDAVRKVMASVIVVRAEHMWDSDKFRYHCISELFEVGSAEKEIPNYIPVIEYKEGLIDSFKLVNENRWELYTDMAAGIISREKYEELCK